jgi:hypothetical protein
MGIDFYELVGAEFAEKWDALAVDLDSVGGRLWWERVSSRFFPFWDRGGRPCFLPEQ